MSKIVRSSKYRHVFGTAAKNEDSFLNIKLSKNAWDSNFLSVSPTFIACCWQTGGGGAVGIISQKTTGKLGEVPLFNGHKGPVLDVAFSPFNDHIVATASEDATVKIWQIPEGGLQKDSQDAVQVLSGHGRKTGSVNFHPSANNVLATSGLDYKVKIWDIEKGDEKFSIDGHTGIIQSVEWSADGSQIATFGKDKKLRVIDPRSTTVIADVEAHAGIKGGRCTWLTNHGKIFTTGFSKTSERQFSIWDPRALKDPLVSQGVDQSAGIIIPFYDEGTGVLYLAGKGDGNIRYYEIVDDSKWIYFLSQYSSTVPQQGMAAMPKRGVNVSTNEVMRLYKATQDKIEPIAFQVPRKSDVFQEDLFPDAPSNEPALTAEEWVGGKTEKPKTRSLAPGFVEKASAAPVAFVKKEENPADSMTHEQLKAEYEKLKSRVSYLEAELTKNVARVKELEAKN